MREHDPITLPWGVVRRARASLSRFVERESHDPRVQDAMRSYRLLSRAIRDARLPSAEDVRGILKTDNP